MVSKSQKSRLKNLHVGSAPFFEQLEYRRLLAVNWRNPLDYLDVSADGFVSPVDALTVINDINANGSRALGENKSPDDRFLDTNGDGFVSPADALLVIRALNNYEDGAFTLTETRSLASEKIFSLQLQPSEGRTFYSVDIAPTWAGPENSIATQDVLNIYVVDPADRSSTILDGGENGTAVFSLSSTSANMVPGIARWNGSRLQIDVTDAISQHSEIYITAQLLSGDDVQASTVTLRPKGIAVDENANAILSFPAVDAAKAPGPELNVDSLHIAEDAKLEIGTLTFASSTGNYSAALRVVSGVRSIARQAVAVIDDLPPGVVVTNASGFTNQGSPYISLMNAIPYGGLGPNSSSSEVRLEIANPKCTRFNLQPTLLVGEENLAPDFSLVDSVVVRPGDSITLPLQAIDADGDDVTYAWSSKDTMPTSTLDGNGRITFRPTPSEIGTYQIDIHASDGQLTTTQELEVIVEADPITTTRITGQVLDTDSQPLAGVPIELGEVSATTNSDGLFRLETPSSFSADALIVRGEAIRGDKSYPFIAEKLPLLFGRDLFEGVNNIIDRPIYLPALDVEGGSMVDPNVDTRVEVALSANEAKAEVLVAAGSLKGRDGKPFDGVLSITEVPAARTPAALPKNLRPDVVVTIQPGEMVFDSTAPLTLPNRAGYSSGQLMDLWSINPVTGDFDDVGNGRVTPDGTSIVTESGGIRNSSWHFFAPPPSNPSPGPPGPCLSCKDVEGLTSSVELDSGALREEHSLVPYNSLGKSRGINLHYGSLMADPRPLISFTYEDVPAVVGPFRLTASLSVIDGNTKTQVPGSRPRFGLPGGEHFWRLPEFGGDLEASIHVDMQSFDSGIYDYELLSGFLRIEDSATGTLNPTNGYFVHVNAQTSPVGVGWVIDGDMQLIDDGTGRILLLDGNHTASVFLEDSDGEYLPTVEDFTKLSRSADGAYVRLLKDQTQQLFNPDGRLVETKDRNNNSTQYIRDSNGHLTKIVDPVGLETTFAYENGLLSTITDPANRTTVIQHDSFGNVKRITDPDGASRTFDYDSQHRLVGETDANGNKETTMYGVEGRVVGGIRKDGVSIGLASLQGQKIYSDEQTNSFEEAPEVLSLADAAFIRDANGHVKRVVLDAFGQATAKSDSIGPLPQHRRDDSNLVSTSIDGRQNFTNYTYDERGNATSISDPVVRVAPEPLFPNQVLTVGLSRKARLGTGDLNKDGYVDFVVANSGENIVSVQVILGDSTGSFTERRSIPISLLAASIAVVDVDGDENLDIVAVSDSRQEVRVLLGEGDGSFQEPLISRWNLGSTNYESMAHGDFDGDGVTDLVVTSGFNIDVLLGDGNGTFIAPARTVRNPEGLGPTSVAVADFNDDGLDDVAYTSSPSGNSNVAILLSTGEGQVSPPTVYPLPSPPTSIAVSDLDGDGRLDLGISTVTGVSLLHGSESGTFVLQEPIQTSIAGEINFTDTNADGFEDIVLVAKGSVVGSGTVFFGSATARFEPSGHFFFAPFSIATTLNDVNGDGVLDAVSLTGVNVGTPNSINDTTITINSGNLSGSFDGPIRPFFVPYDNSLDTGDFNGDGISDFAFTDKKNNRVVIRQGNVDQTFSEEYSVAVGDAPSFLMVDDINGDGLSDFVTTNRNSSDLSVLFSLGNESFAPQLRLSTAPEFSFPHRIEGGDFNGDGRRDLLLSDGSLFLGRDGDRFELQSTPIRWGVKNSVDVADLNGDEIDDILVGNFFGDNDNDDNKVKIYFGSELGAFSSPVEFITGDSPNAVTTGDFNGDGRVDVAALNTTSKDISILLGRDGGDFSSAVSFPAFSTEVNRPATFLSTGDFDGDGVTDLAAHVQSTSATSVFLGNGDGSFGPSNRFALGHVEQIIPAGDFNSDGIDDLFALADRQVFILPGNGRLDEIPQKVEPPRFTYDSVFNQLTSSIDELGRVTHYTLDPSNGNVLRERHVVGLEDSIENGETDDVVRSFEYTAQGQIDLEIDPLGRVTDYGYDDLGRLNQITFAKGTLDESSVRFAHDAAGNQTDRWDENGNHTAYTFDLANRILTTTLPDPDGNGPLERPSSQFGFDANGNLRFVTDPEGSTTENRYDALDRVFETIAADPDGAGPLLAPVTKFTYDRNGNRIQTIDPLGNTERNEYDERNRVVANIAPDGGVTSFRYDVDGNMVSLRDPLGNITRFVYDSRNRLIAEVDPLGKITKYAYDAVDNLIRKTDRLGRVTEFEYDQLDRLTQENWLTSAVDSTLENQITYSYDKAGNLEVVEDKFSKLAYTYDDRDRVKTIDNAGTPDAPEVLLTYQYDDVGNVESVTDTLTNGDTSTTIYGFDPLNRTTSIKQSGDGVSDKLVKFEYNQLGQYKSIDRYSDLIGTNLVVGTDYDYDDLNRLKDLEHGNSSGELLAYYRYSYDTDSRIAQIVDIYGTTDYAYDDRDQLTQAYRAENDGRGDEEYDYDANGNRIRSSRHGPGYETGLANRLKTDGTYNYDYDDEGNMRRRTNIETKEVREFEWDHRNRLVRVTNKTDADLLLLDANFVYDSFNRRIAKVVDVDGNGIETERSEHFVYDRQHIALEYVDGDGYGINQQPILELRSLFGPGIDRIIAQDVVSFSQPRWLLTDHLGTVHEIVGDSATVLNHITFDSYGNILAQSNVEFSTRYAFAGREFASELGFYSFRARYYAADLGTFLSEDIEQDGMNPRAYVRNSTVRYRDPFGTSREDTVPPSPVEHNKCVDLYNAVFNTCLLSSVPFASRFPIVEFCYRPFNKKQCASKARKVFQQCIESKTKPKPVVTPPGTTATCGIFGCE